MNRAHDSCHIGIFVPSLCGGGAERVMVTLANGFAARGHRVDLVLARAEGPYLCEVTDGVRVVDLDKGRVLTSLFPLVRYLRRERPAAMLSAMGHANTIAIIARELARVHTRLAVSERNSLVNLKQGGKAAAFRHLNRWFYPWADHVIAVSREMVGELVAELRLSPDHVTAIPNPVDCARLQTLARERPSHRWLEPGAPPVILAVGRLVPQKDHSLLIKAFARLSTERSVRLVILGEGPLRPALERQIIDLSLTDSVELAGFHANPFAWMAACSVFVLTSRFEGFPNVLVQAMACGARIVSTDCPTGPNEILEGGRWGRLVPVGDANALASAFAAALDDLNPPDVTARTKAFSVDMIVGSYLQVLRAQNAEVQA